MSDWQREAIKECLRVHGATSIVLADSDPYVKVCFVGSRTIELLEDSRAPMEQFTRLRLARDLEVFLLREDRADLHSQPLNLTTHGNTIGALRDTFECCM